MKTLALILTATCVLSARSALADHSDRSYSLNYGTSYVTNVTANNHDSYSDGEMNFRRNFGKTEWGLGLMFGTAPDHTSEGIRLLGDFNFVENKDGNDLIPYAGLRLTAVNASSNATSQSGQAQLGLKWFPFGEIFAVDAAIYYQASSTSDLRYADLQGVGATLGWSIY